MTTSSQTMSLSARANTSKDDYFTYIEGVGPIPRDIYKYVESNPLGDLPRYSIHIVIQHLLVCLSFLMLAATGLPLYFSDLFWAPYLVMLFGGIDTAMFLHKIAAAVMIMASVYHTLTIVGGTLVKVLQGKFDYRRTQIPSVKDLKDLIQDVRYFLGLAPYRPKMNKFMYKQKLHYLAIVWGTTVLVVAGSALLFPDTVSRLFPETLGRFVPESVVNGVATPAFLQDLARLMHADEAVMILIVLVFWHWPNVHLVPGRFPVQWTFLTGKITREHQIEEHFLEYLHNLQEIPEEREYMRNLLREKGFLQHETVPLSELPVIFEDPAPQPQAEDIQEVTQIAR